MIYCSGITATYTATTNCVGGAIEIERPLDYTLGKGNVIGIYNVQTNTHEEISIATGVNYIDVDSFGNVFGVGYSYVTNTSNFYSIDLTGSSKTYIASAATNIETISIYGDSVYGLQYSADTISLYSATTTTWDFDLINVNAVSGSSGWANGVSSAAYDTSGPNDTLYFGLYSGSSLNNYICKMGIDGNNYQQLGNSGISGISEFGLISRNGDLRAYDSDFEYIINKTTGSATINRTLSGWTDSIVSVVNINKNSSGYFNFIWSNGATTQNIYNLDAGVYTLTVIEQISANTCNYIFNLSDPACVPFTGGTCCMRFNYQCVINSNNIPSITITSITGGTAPYYYSLNGIEYQTGTTFNNLSYGYYVVLVSDVCGCCKTYETIYIPKPPELSCVTEFCDDGSVNISLKRDDGTKKETYIDENGTTWTILNKNPYINNCNG